MHEELGGVLDKAAFRSRIGINLLFRNKRYGWYDKVSFNNNWENSFKIMIPLLDFLHFLPWFFKIGVM
jgi:hypothetical protein